MRLAAKIILGVLFIHVILLGLALGIFGAVTDKSAAVQQEALIFGFLTAISALVAFVCLVMRDMQFNFYYKVEKIFCASAVLACVLPLVFFFLI